MRRQRNAKIICTLGPASSSVDAINALFLAGADVFRLNFSHGDSASHRLRVEAIRACERRHGRPIAIMADLQGPKIRIGGLDQHVYLKTGAEFRLDLENKPGNARRACLPHPDIFRCLRPGNELMLDDGKIRLRIEACGDEFAETRVIAGGPLSGRKGVNIPGALLPVPALSERDRSDLEDALEMGADWIALSFVQRPADIEDARAIIGERAMIMAKIEKPSAIDCLDEIVAAADGVMVARGDLGVEIPAEEVPIAQRRILRASHQSGKPVVVATQMLESMVSSPSPTRAETSDVASAIYDGADAVMLSAETSVGRHPVKSVSVMDSIIRRVERDPHYRLATDLRHQAPNATHADAICCASRRTTQVLKIMATVTYSHSGFTSLRASRERPESPILSLTPCIRTARRLTAVWGIHSVQIDRSADDESSMASLACDFAVLEGFAKVGDDIVIAAGVPFGVSGVTNLLRIITIPPIEIVDNRKSSATTGQPSG